MDDDKTVTIPVRPKPSSLAWLGAAASTAALSWIISLIWMALSDPNDHQLIAGILSASTAVTITAVVIWAKYSIARMVAANHALLREVLGGQHAFVMAEIRGVNRRLEVVATQAAADRRVAGAKINRIMAMIPDYFHGVADGVEAATGTDNVRDIGRARIPRNN